MLTQLEIDACREAFVRFDKETSGYIGITELKLALQALGQNPTDEELFMMVSQVQTEDSRGGIGFSEFLMIIEDQKKKVAAMDDETDTIEAFVALGGSPDKSGVISTEKLKNMVKEFGLTIDIDQLIREIDKDGTGYVDYEDFKTMLA